MGINILKSLQSYARTLHLLSIEMPLLVVDEQISDEDETPDELKAANQDQFQKEPYFFRQYQIAYECGFRANSDRMKYQLSFKPYWMIWYTM